MKPGREAACERVYAGSTLDLGPETVAMYGGPVDTGKVKPAIERLEFFSWGVRLRSRSLISWRVLVRDIRYEELTELALLSAAGGAGDWRGIRLRAWPAQPPIYFLAGRKAVPQLVAAFAQHGLGVTGQVRRTRLPYANAFVYPDGMPEPLP